MFHSEFFAQLIGIYLAISAIGELIHQKQFKQAIAELISSQIYIQLSGSLNLFLGLSILISHHTWVSTWPVAITIIGYLVVLRGSLRLLAPLLFVRCAKWLLEKKGTLLASWIKFVVGCYFIWAGFTQ
jgi:hypothetical protein